MGNILTAITVIRLLLTIEPIKVVVEIDKLAVLHNSGGFNN